MFLIKVVLESAYIYTTYFIGINVVVRVVDLKKEKVLFV